MCTKMENKQFLKKKKKERKKESLCNAGDLGSIPGSGRCPGGGRGNPLQYPGLQNRRDTGAWRGYSAWGRRESDTTAHPLLGWKQTCALGSLHQAPPPRPRIAVRWPALMTFDAVALQVCSRWVCLHCWISRPGSSDSTRGDRPRKGRSKPDPHPAPRDSCFAGLKGGTPARASAAAAGER